MRSNYTPSHSLVDVAPLRYSPLLAPISDEYFVQDLYFEVD